MHQGFPYSNISSDMWALGELFYVLCFKNHSSTEAERKETISTSSSNSSRVKLVNLQNNKILRHNARFGEKVLVSMLEFDPYERLRFEDL